jgi:hypothetical protein
MRPDAGETARIVRHSEILVGEGMLVLQPIMGTSMFLCFSP